MTDILKLEIQTICIVHIVAIILSIVFLMLFYTKATKNHALNWFIVVQCSMIGWMVFKIFKTVAPNETLRWIFIVGYYICACILEISFLEFGYSYMYGKSIRKSIRIFLWTLVGIQIAVIATNPLHHMFYKTYTFWKDTFGVLFIVHTIIEYTFIGVGFYFCSKMFRIRFTEKNKFYRVIVSSAILFPLIVNVLFITKVIHRFVFSLGWYVIFDITPIVFTWSMLVFVFATVNSEFLSLSPILRHEIVHKLDTPIVVLNRKYQMLYANSKFKENIAIDSDELSRLMSLNQNKTTFEAENDDRYIRVNCKIVNDQFVLILKDITPYKVIENELNSKQDELDEKNKILANHIDLLKESSKVGARNYVARELHDIVGHSLVVTIKLLEVAKMYYHQDRSLSFAAIEDAKYSLQTGLNSMQNIRSDGVTKCYTGFLLRKELRRVLDAIKYTGIQTKLSVKGLDKEIEERVYDIIMKISKELITNSLKHSNAKEIFVSVNVTYKDIHLMIIDNGDGCRNLLEGNGLIGIRSRLDLINGSVEFITRENDGFMSKIKLNQVGNDSRLT